MVFFIVFICVFLVFTGRDSSIEEGGGVRSTANPSSIDRSVDSARRRGRRSFVVFTHGAYPSIDRSVGVK